MLTWQFTNRPQPVARGSAPRNRPTFGQDACLEILHPLFIITYARKGNAVGSAHESFWVISRRFQFRVLFWDTFHFYVLSHNSLHLASFVHVSWVSMQKMILRRSYWVMHRRCVFPPFPPIQCSSLPLVTEYTWPSELAVGSLCRPIFGYQVVSYSTTGTFGVPQKGVHGESSNAKVKCRGYIPFADALEVRRDGDAIGDHKTRVILGHGNCVNDPELLTGWR